MLPVKDHCEDIPTSISDKEHLRKKYLDKKLAVGEKYIKKLTEAEQQKIKEYQKLTQEAKEEDQ